MPSYICKIGTADGRVVEKQFEASSKEQLKDNLQEQGFYVFQIKRKAFQLFSATQRQTGSLSGRRFLSFLDERAKSGPGTPRNVAHMMETSDNSSG